MTVFVLDKNDKPLMPCSEKRGRQLLAKRQAVAVRRAPFVIKLLGFEVAAVASSLRLKLDPGSKTTGMALLDGSKVLWIGELIHRQGLESKMKDRAAIRRGRRSRNTRYRAARFDNRCRSKGWLPPSSEARVNQVLHAVAKLRTFAPIGFISFEDVKFDTQKMENPEISGVEYQQGTLEGYEIGAYLQEKFNHKCAYCGKADYENPGLKFEKDHIKPRSKGGSDRVSNLVYTCQPCNKKKGDKDATAFGHPEVMKLAKATLKDAAAVNSIRSRLLKDLRATGLEVETDTGGRTKFNRARLGLPKSHCIDAVCVGASTPEEIKKIPSIYATMKATGRGSRRIMRSDAYGFPRQYRGRAKRVSGFATGDLIKIDSGKNTGQVGRLTARVKGPYIMVAGKRCSCSYKKITMLQRGDGWEYGKEVLPSMEAKNA